MIGIKKIAGYVPDSYEDNYLKKERFGIDDAFIRDKIGVERVSRKGADEETSDMCLKAFHNLQSKADIAAEKVECVAVCSQNPDGCGIPHTSAIVHGKLGFPESCAAFDISLGCSGYVYALSIVKSFMEANGFGTGLLFTADPYSKVLDPGDKNTILLFGDAATVTLLSKEDGTAERWYPEKFLFGTRGREWDALNNKKGVLEMNGRAIFNFCATTIPDQIRRLLDSTNLSTNDIDAFIFHQGSKYIIDTLVRRLNLLPHKAPLKLSGQGNTVSSSIPLVLEDYLEKKGMERIILSGFGVGLSWASCLITKNDARR